MSVTRENQGVNPAAEEAGEGTKSCTNQDDADRRQDADGNRGACAVDDASVDIATLEGVAEGVSGLRFPE